MTSFSGHWKLTGPIPQSFYYYNYNNKSQTIREKEAN